MAKSVEQLWRERTDLKDIGNPQLRRALRQRYEQERQGAINQYNAWAADNTDESGNVAPIADYFSEFGAASQQYTVKDGDNLSTIAGANNTTVPDLLKQNPDVKKLQTGMVINTPGSEAWRAKNLKPYTANPNLAYQNSERNKVPTAFNQQKQSGGIGVPSAGPLGAGPGAAAYQQSERTQTPVPSQFQDFIGDAKKMYNQFGNAVNRFSTNENLAALAPVLPGVASGLWARNRYLQGLQNNQAGNVPRQYQNYYNVATANQPAVTPTTPQTQGAPNFDAAMQNLINRPAQTPQDKSNAFFQGPISSADRILMNVAYGDKTPSAQELKILISKGIVLPPTGGSGGLNDNYSYGNMKRKRGGGGGGGARLPNMPAPRVGQGERLPAFSQGGGFNGLINWRI